jgi:hypothetical protein
LSEEEIVSSFVSGASRWSGIVLILATGLIHLIETSHHFEAAAYVGWLFVANFVGSLLAAVGIYRGALWGWLLGVLIAAGAFVLFLVSRTLGLPATGGEFVGHWTPMGIVSLVAEGLFVALYLSVTALRR